MRPVAYTAWEICVMTAMSSLLGQPKNCTTLSLSWDLSTGLVRPKDICSRYSKDQMGKQRIY